MQPSVEPLKKINRMLQHVSHIIYDNPTVPRYYDRLLALTTEASYARLQLLSGDAHADWLDYFTLPSQY